MPYLARDKVWLVGVAAAAHPAPSEILGEPIELHLSRVTTQIVKEDKLLGLRVGDSRGKRYHTHHTSLLEHQAALVNG